jgi:predicted esterase
VSPRDRPGWFVLAVLALLVPARLARGDGGAPRRTPGPCPDCITSLPPGAEPRPLLVLLHGDGETAASMYDAWQPSASARGIAVLALACPRAEGCASQSWWRWNGDPAWLVRQVRAVGELRPIDPARTWIVGWSGGASYLGFRTQAIEETFAAIVIHGGGMPPAAGACASRPAGVYFLVGSANPLHSLAVGLRGHYDACGNDVTWTLLPGVDHDGERRALAAHREAILDWLATRRLTVTAPADATRPPDRAPGPCESGSCGAHPRRE